MKVGSLYSNAIDGFAYAAQMLGMDVCWQVEINKEYHRYLNKNYPESEKHQYDGYVGKRNLEKVDIICGGDPCQPHSVSGIRRGKTDDRYRWPEMYRIIEELRPNWVVNENVAGTISNMVLDQKIADLEKIGYTCQSYVIPAVAVNAYHIRNRVFLVAYANVYGRGGVLHYDDTTSAEAFKQTTVLDSSCHPFLQFEKRMGRPPVLPYDDGLPDRILRLGSAGDTIVANIPIILLSAIKAINSQII